MSITTEHGMREPTTPGFYWVCWHPTLLAQGYQRTPFVVLFDPITDPIQPVRLAGCSEPYTIAPFVWLADAELPASAAAHFPR